MFAEKDTVGAGGLLQFVCPPPPPPPPPVSGPLPAQPVSATSRTTGARKATVFRDDAAGRTAKPDGAWRSASRPADRRCGIDDLLAQARHLIPRLLPPAVG